MGNHKHKWTEEEVDALLAGVSRHGLGKWKIILNDPDFAPFFSDRSNIDLKDKWRNLSVKKISSDAQDSGPAESVDAVTDNALKGSTDGKNEAWYVAMVFEALSSLKGSNCSDLGAIVNFIEQKHEVPKNFRRMLSANLKRLVAQGKVERVEDNYIISQETSPGTKLPTPKPKKLKPQNPALITCEAMADAAAAAAYKVAEAENRMFQAEQAVKEAERIAVMAEHAEATLQFVKEIYEQCLRGEVVLLA